MKKNGMVLIIFLTLLFANPLITQANAASNDTSRVNKIADSTNANYVFISVIKSVAGKEPSSEFLDINCKFNFSSLVYSLLSIDVALSTVHVDTAQRTEDKLTEAGFSLNLNLMQSSDSLRRFAIGLPFKVFEGIPYAGFQIGSVESNVKSKLHTSYAFLGYLRRLQDIDQQVNQTRDIKESYNNLYAEFAIHSSHIDFLKNLRIKGSILFPINESNSKINGIESRIVIEIPIGGIESF